ncbi:MAG: NAD(P)H-dependent oxidoreductase [Pyrinomonadaceae bacterium]
MNQKPKILAIPGSLRARSLNRKVLRTAAGGAEKAGAEVTVIDLKDFPMPVYDPDEHEAGGFDPKALAFQRLVREHDGFLVASPEYNGSVTGALKNAIDWASVGSGEFPREEVFRDKFAAIMTASPGSFGGVRTLSHLRAIMTSVGVHVLPTEIAVTFAPEKFEGEEMIDPKTRDILENLGASLTEIVRAMRIRPENENGAVR